MCIRDRVSTQSTWDIKMEGKAQRKEGTHDNHLTITGRRNPGFYVFVGKKTLANYPTIELHALGTAMSVAVSAADMLISFGYATLKKTTVENIELVRGEGAVKRTKLVITLAKSANFNSLIAKADAIKKENESKFMEIEGPKRTAAQVSSPLT
eukprot:TRINITY_DN314_c0_g1_i4.p2 TRINITY_DN314_c0_g1~~TRINITY_DN314_c0_g1_i4.p2  ORF type:complete len:153 (-),score=26.29 TRINITY_DN314_c0_g1_i4:26-484(-)